MQYGFRNTPLYFLQDLKIFQKTFLKSLTKENHMILLNCNHYKFKFISIVEGLQSDFKRV